MPKVFKTFTTTLIGLMLVLVVVGAVVSFSSFIQTIGKLEPGQKFSEILMTPIVSRKDNLKLSVDLGPDIGRCEIFSVRRIYHDDGERKFFWSQLGLFDETQSRSIVSIPLHEFPPGLYVYHADVHFVCEGESYVRSTLLYKFTVTE